MFCPRCRSEYRPGFTRCADCDVDLVEDLAGAGATHQVEPAAPRPSGPMVDFCGFFTLEEAREARDQLRRQGIRSEIAIRETPHSDLGDPVRDEYWIRFAASDYRIASAVIGYDEATEHGPTEQVSSGGTTNCSACRKPVKSEEVFCPHCGARFGEERG